MRSGAVQIVFANESELHSLYETADFDTALAQLRAENILGVVHALGTGQRRDERRRGSRRRRPFRSRTSSTTGAGDLFAAGFFAGYTKGRDLVTCAKLGALAAAEIIQHIGARPQKDLRQLAERNGLGRRATKHARRSFRD